MAASCAVVGLGRDGASLLCNRNAYFGSYKFRHIRGHCSYFQPAGVLNFGLGRDVRAEHGGF